MIILGSQRNVIVDFKKHRNAEDYSGEHLSNIRFNGVGKVVSVVNKYKCYEDTIDKNDFYRCRSNWKDGEYYNCTSITGKKVKYHKNELGGNSVLIESYDNQELLYFKILHMADVYVKEGDIVNTNTLIGTQGNTGVVLSNKLRTNPTYGTQIHYQVTNKIGNYINPRKYATANVITKYPNNLENKENNNYKLIFKCKKTDMYAIKLNKGEELYIKK